jgi:death on curing protein
MTVEYGCLWCRCGADDTVAVRYLSPDDLIFLNQVEVGADNPVDTNMLEAAAGRPRQSAGLVDAFPTIHVKAAALFDAVISYHPFIILGNKRTAIHAVRYFYALNGWMMTFSDTAMYNLAVRIADAHDLSVEEIARTFEEWASAIPDVDEDED